MRKNVVIIIAILYGLLLQSCSSVNTPPSIAEQEKIFCDNYDDIVTLLDYMFASEYHWISISRNRDTIIADFNVITIEDDAVADAVARLLKHYYGIFKEGNVVDFSQWKGLKDIGSGIVYTLDGDDYGAIHAIGYITELVPLSKENWFYYVDDYEKWRAERSKAE